MGTLYSLYQNSQHRNIPRFKRILRLVGYNVRGPIFDQEMEKAVKAYQKSRKLDDDGVIGSNTMSALFEDQDLLGSDFINAVTPLKTDRSEVVNLKATMFDIVSLLHTSDAADGVVKEIVVSAGNILKSIEGKI